VIFPAYFSNSKDKCELNIERGNEEVTLMAYRKNETCFKVRGRFAMDPHGVYICLVNDVSGYDAIEKELNRLKNNTTDVDRMKSEFVANVTHELRTPVNGIQGNTQELLMMAQDQDMIRILRLIERGCTNMHSLINNILDFSKLEAGKFQLERREFSFRDMIEYVRSNHINKIQEKGLNLFISISPDIPEVLVGDELRVAQILNNLLSNATKFTSVGKIMLEAITTKTVNGRIELFFMVVDTGIGIDKKDQDHLFKSFSQVDASVSRRYGGTGLGLCISKQLVELMGGAISVESEPGKGTMFNFSIWLDLPGGVSVTAANAGQYLPYFKSLSEFDKEAETARHFGSEENRAEIHKRLVKLNLCIDMSTWDKAEAYADAIKQLTDGAPHEVKVQVLKLKMAVQKENSLKAIAEAAALDALIDDCSEGEHP
jgi:nitrogen-specific signal transduction histidine kinase